MAKNASQILSFANKGKNIIYNPTVPFEYKNKKYIGVRAESLNDELNSKILFAYETDKGNAKWEIDYSIPSLNLQDPALVKIGKTYLLAGVRVNQREHGVEWKTDFYNSDSIGDLEYLLSGPKGMKDIRLIELKDRLGIFTRPQGGIYNGGKIGYFEAKNLNELKTLSENDWYDSAKIICGLFDEEHWGGVNQAINLPFGDIGIIGHVANQINNNKGELEKYYHAMAFTFNPKEQTQSEFKIIVRRNDFPSTPSKRTPELDNVFFPAGIDGEDNLYAGISDYCCGNGKIKNPFDSN